jgi:YD repeat-containing protein
LLLERQVRSGTTVVQSETLTWAAGPSISTDDLPNGNWNGTGGQLYDNEIIAPRLTTRVITRDGGTYTTSYSGYDAFGNPGTIGESGELARTTTLTYHVDTSKNIVHGRPTSEAVTVGSETFTTTSAYDPNGNLTSRSRYGVTTEYGYTNGNLTSRTNARNVTISFQYTRGVVSRITNPFYFVQRSINWSGTVASETNGRGHTTSFGYDALDRLTSINPPLEATTSITYNNTGATNWRVTKGVTFTQSNVDGLGRVASTAASEGINTRRTYNACGQVSYESYPHTTQQRGDSRRRREPQPDEAARAGPRPDRGQEVHLRAFGRQAL